ncbi:hypothetical protein [Thermococcus sp.]|uniref:hypothetical protein n=1 Tax=Thermococcus sp. TaxID=35749 RepID=UPI00260750B4|nr:hypothetical protein [Thermococcus sp.]
MPRGMGRYGRGRGFYPLSGVYWIIELLILLGILYFMVKLLLVALPYALGLLVLIIIWELIRPPQRVFRPF